MAPSYNPDEILNAIQRADYRFVLENAMPHALAGNPDAQCTVALKYESGFGIQRDFLEARRWLLKATQQNSSLAWNNLGTLYAAKHPGLENRWGQARNCYEKAATLGFDCGDPYPPP
jgi:TPR repeat protein